MVRDDADRTCRFCGVTMDADAADDLDFHPACAEPPHDDEDRRDKPPAHPMYGLGPGPFVQPG